MKKYLLILSILMLSYCGLAPVAENYLDVDSVDSENSTSPELEGGTSPDISVDQWLPLGGKDFTPGTVASLAFSLDPYGDAYIAYANGMNGNKITAMKYHENNGWETIGTPFGNGGVGMRNISLTVRIKTPYIAYQDMENGGRATVKKYNGRDWETVGTAGFSIGKVDEIVLYFDTVWSRCPYIAYRDSANFYKVTVKKYNGREWETVGQEGITDRYVNTVSFTVKRGIPYLAYTDNRGSGGKVIVKKYNGREWEMLGSQGASSGPAYFTSIDVGQYPYVVYRNMDDYNRDIIVRKYNGREWETVGQEVSSGELRPLLLISPADQMPYVSYVDDDFDEGIEVDRYNGREWEAVGTPIFDAESYLHNIGFQIDYEGIPYVLYYNGNSKKATLMKLIRNGN